MPYKNQLDEFNARFVSGALPFKLSTSLNKYKTQATDDGKSDSTSQVENTEKNGTEVVPIISASAEKKSATKQSVSSSKTSNNININKITSVPKTDKNINKIKIASDEKKTPSVQKANSTNEKIVDNFGDGTELGLSSGLPAKETAYKVNLGYKDGISKYPSGENIPVKNKGKITLAPYLPKSLNSNQKTLRVDDSKPNLVSTEKNTYNLAASNNGKVEPVFSNNGNNTSGKNDLSIKSDVARKVSYARTLAAETLITDPTKNTSNSTNSRITNDMVVNTNTNPSKGSVAPKILDGSLTDLAYRKTIYKTNTNYNNGITSYPNSKEKKTYDTDSLVKTTYADTNANPKNNEVTSINNDVKNEINVVYKTKSSDSGKEDTKNLSAYGKFAVIPDDNSKTTLTSALKSFDSIDKKDGRDTTNIKQQASLPDAFSKTNIIEPLPDFLKKDIISYGIDNSKANSAKEEIFVKNLIPYFGANILQQIQNAATSPGSGSGLDKTLNIASAAFGVRSMLAKFSNLDALEAAKVAGLMPEAFIMQELVSTVTGLGSFSLRGSSIKDPGVMTDAARIDAKTAGKISGIANLGMPLTSPNNLGNNASGSIQINKDLDAAKGLDKTKNRLDNSKNINKRKTNESANIKTKSNEIISKVDTNLNLTDNSKNNLELAKERLKRFGDAFSIGYILVVPFKAGLESRIKIPFQMTPNLGNESVSAVYNNETLLHRSSELYNYTSSKRDGYSLTTSYYALAPGSIQEYYKRRNTETPGQSDGALGKRYSEDNGDLTNPTNSDQNDYIQHWSMDVIQDIQLAYKALSLPTYPNGSEVQFRRPPFIKIVVGSDAAEDEGIKNMLYRNPAAGENDGNNRFFKSVTNVTADGSGINMTSKTAWKTVKTFVVSSVAVDKKTGELPYVFDRSGKPLDTMGFDVTLNLLEVAPSYMDLEPDFEANINFAVKKTKSDQNGKYVLPVA
jgi:hypothetical protein